MSNALDLADALKRASEDAAANPAPRPTNPHDADALVVALAERFGEDPKQVLTELRKGSALARLCRKILDVNIRKPFTLDEQIYLTWSLLESEGFKGEALKDETAKCWNERDRPLDDKTKPITPDSAKTRAYRGKATLEERASRSPLAKLFGG